MLLESRGEKKLTEGSYDGRKRTERAALSKKGAEKKKKDKNNKEKREKRSREWEVRVKKVSFLN